MATTLRTSGITMGDSTMDVSGSAPSFPARAFVNFNGTGVVAIRESGNVSSITDNGTGDFTVNFTTAMPDANYAVVGTAMSGDNAFNTRGLSGTSSNAQTTTGAGVRTIDLNTSAAHTAGADASKVFVAIFR